MVWRLTMTFDRKDMTKDETSCYGCMQLGHIRKGFLCVDFYCTQDLDLVGNIRKEIGIKNPCRKNSCNFCLNKNPKILSRKLCISLVNIF